jgi:hypothetical protein
MGISNNTIKDCMRAKWFKGLLSAYRGRYNDSLRVNHKRITLPGVGVGYRDLFQVDIDVLDIDFPQRFELDFTINEGRHEDMIRRAFQRAFENIPYEVLKHKTKPTLNQKPNKQGD